MDGNMNRQQRRAAQRMIQKVSAEFTSTFQEIPRSNWSKESVDPKRLKVWRNNKFLVQSFAEKNGIIRLSINRTATKTNGNWQDNITWDELQSIKNSLGFSELDAIEVFPAAIDVVNVANIRHLWIMSEKLDFIWRW